MKEIFDLNLLYMAFLSYRAKSVFMCDNVHV